MNKYFKKVVVSALALSMMIPVAGGTESQAASKKPTLPKKVSVTVKKTKTVKVTSKKAVKKTTWSVNKKKIVSLSKKAKKSVKVKGLKKGSVTLTAKVKVGKKTYKLKSKITVKAGAVVTPKPSTAPTGNNNKATAAPTAAPTASATPVPTPVPTFRTLTDVTAEPIEAKDESEFVASPVEPTVNPATALGMSVDFEDVAVGTTTTDAITGAGISGAVLRGYDPDDVLLKGDYLKVTTMEAEDKEPETGANDTTNVLKVHRTNKTWQGVMFDLTDELEAGCTYTLTAKVFAPGSQDLYCSYQLQTDPNIEASYGNFGPDSGHKYTYKAGAWRDVSVTISIPDDKYYYGLYFESADGKGTGDFYVDDIQITKTKEVYKDMTLKSLAETYSDIFPIVGGAAGIDSLLGTNGRAFIKSQYNAYTPGNEMKPDAILGSAVTSISLDEAKELGYYIPDNYASFKENHVITTDDDDNEVVGDLMIPKLNFDKVDMIMKTCYESGIKLRGHTLLWHQQTPVYFFQSSYSKIANVNRNVSESCMDARLEMYVKTVMKHVLSSEYADCLYAYDVVNEYLHSTNEESGKPTYWDEIYNTKDATANQYMSKSKVTLRPKFVKEAFQFAHDMLVEYNKTDDVKLFYNDYNTYESPKDVIYLTDFINEDGQICDGIGMQSHLDINSNFHTAQNFANALKMFTTNSPKLEIQLTELDANKVVGTDSDEKQAAYYDQIMNAVLTNKKQGGNITGIVIWSLYDGVSWRAANAPCLFKGIFNPKSSYYAVLNARKFYYDAK